MRPNHIEQALAQMHENQWFTWTDSKNKIYANLKLSDKLGVRSESTRLNSSHTVISYAVFCLKKKKKREEKKNKKQTKNKKIT